jgi:hypothetical protein
MSKMTPRANRTIPKRKTGSPRNPVGWRCVIVPRRSEKPPVGNVPIRNSKVPTM